MKKTNKPASYEVNRKIRKDWGEVSPITKVIPDKRGRKADKAAKKEARDY